MNQTYRITELEKKVAMLEIKTERLIDIASVHADNMKRLIEIVKRLAFGTDSVSVKS